MVQNALIVTFVYWVIKYSDDYLLGWQTISRPLVIAPMVGLALGDIRTGMMMGAMLESIFMGISYIGGTAPADATLASVLSVAFTILGNSTMEAGLALAAPIGTVMSSIEGMTLPLYSSLAPYWEQQAVKGNIRSFMIKSLLFTAFVQQFIPCIVLFIGVAYGIDGLNSLLAALPTWVMTGLGAATGMLIAVGFAILTSMIWSTEVACFFFIGYVLAKFLNLGTLPIAIIAASVAITMFLSEKRFIDLKNSLGGKEVKKEEEFF